MNGLMMYVFFLIYFPKIIFTNAEIKKKSPWMLKWLQNYLEIKKKASNINS